MDSFLDKSLQLLRFREAIKYIPKGAIVCDVGCGRQALFLKKIAGLIKYGFGFDKDVENYKNSKLELKKLQISSFLPLKNEVVDVVTLLAVLEHLENPQEILKESFRILKNGGRLILTTPTPPAKPLLEFLAFKLKIIDQKEIKDHKNYFWPSEIRKYLVLAGFKEENISIKPFEFGLNQIVIAKK